MLSRRLLPLARAGRQCMWLTPVRGKKDLPVWSPFRRRGGSLWEPDFFRPFGARDPFKMLEDNFRAVDRMWPSLWRDFGERMQTVHGANAEIVEAKIDSEGLYVKLNVSHYEPDELNVKVVNDRITIAAKHEQKSDEHGFVSREFTREFVLPEDVDQDTLASRLTEDGHLIISAKVKKEAQGRSINIERESSSKGKEEGSSDH
ncbi:hypothetical protein BaRGS_00012385 [Batillaria attramentaria]|uniref:SHSP domain-containing protein n=1 Tax=Batillaria attramentaria TaxID=370345 RepID=A0ABD0LAS3_9CAEN